LTTFQELFNAFQIPFPDLSVQYFTMSCYTVLASYENNFQYNSQSQWFWKKTEIQGLWRISSIKFQNIQDLIWCSRIFQVLKKLIFSTNFKDL